MMPNLSCLTKKNTKIPKSSNSYITYLFFWRILNFHNLNFHPKILTHLVTFWDKKFKKIFFGQISTSEISKFEEILGKNPKIRFFVFSSVGGNQSKCPNITKNVFSRSISPFKALKWILGPKMILNGQKWILKRVHIFQMWEKIQKKMSHFWLKKKCFLIFFEKKYFFDVF